MRRYTCRAAKADEAIEISGDAMATLLHRIMLAAARRMRPSLPRTRGLGRWLGILVAAAAALVPLAGQAQFTDRNKAQAQCELSAIRDTRSPVAIAWIRTACNWLAMNTGSLNESNRRFYTCLLQSLSGAQSDAAANQIIGACRTNNPL
jgi:hypothetical protein